MKYPFETDCLTPIASMRGEDSTETLLLHEMLACAEKYVHSFGWCPPIVERFLGMGIGGVTALFLFRFERPINDTDEWLWVVEGDLPSAYFVIDEAPDPASALNVYCEMMDEWINAVENGDPLDTVFPIAAPATKENAKMLRTRVRFIRDQILPTL